MKQFFGVMARTILYLKQGAHIQMSLSPWLVGEAFLMVRKI